jgi:GT2 family glycosyltransferase
MTPIRQVELAAPLTDITVPDDARRCMLIYRWRNRVIGRATVTVREGRISRAELADIVRQQPPDAALDAVVDDLIGYDARLRTATVTPGVTVAICTRERPDDLARALEAVAMLRPAPLETLVIDNAPLTTATRDVVARAPQVRYVREDRRGLNAARNGALREARGDIVAFTDDDAVPEPEWIAGFLPNFSDPTIAVAGGLTLPLLLETEGQELFEEHCTFVRGFHRRVFNPHQHDPFSVHAVGAGANMAVRRIIALELGGFDERLDGGMPTRSGGDHDLFVRAMLAGHRLVYDPAAVSWHRHRRTKEELLDTVYGYGVGVYAMWTGLLVERREVGMLRLAWHWFRDAQLRNVLQRRDPVRRAIAWEELKGCLRGPAAWLAASRTRQRGGTV